MKKGEYINIVGNVYGKLTFECFEDAVKAREEAEIKYFGFNKE